VKREVLSLAAILALASCASTPAIPPGTPCVVTGANAALYKYGPAQSFGADLTLPYGTNVTMIERAFGYSRVMTANGITGFVSNDDFDPVHSPPPKKEEKPAATATTRKQPKTFAGPVKRSNVAPTPSDPLFDVNDTPLPTVDDTPNKPKFRVNPVPKPVPVPAKKP
jgi:hypothetical protein